MRQKSCFWLEFVRTVDPKTEKNRVRIDVAPPADGDLPTEVAWLVAQGATTSSAGAPHARILR